MRMLRDEIPIPISFCRADKQQDALRSLQALKAAGDSAIETVGVAAGKAN